VSRAVGARCDRNSECDQRCLPPSQYPGGFCTLACDTNDACPGRSVCADIDTSVNAEEVDGVCLFPCSNASFCEFLGEGWDCVYLDILPMMEAQVCIPPK